jgi:hypothetical protein
MHNPVAISGGPSIWKFYKNYKLRENVVKQTAEVIDKSEVKEPSLLLIKNKYIRKGEFIVAFNAEKAGIISVAFKYMNKDNFFIFEIGGYKEKQKFFRLRKKSNGMVTIIKKIDSVNEMPKEAFGKNNKKLFGYNKDMFYRVRIVLSKKTIKIFYSKLGKREILIFDVLSSDLPYGQVGFGTFLTTAAFDSISLKPVVATKRMLVNPEELNAAVKDDDVFVYEKEIGLAVSKPNQSKRSKKKNDLINNLKKNLAVVKDSKSFKKKNEKMSWMKCLRRITPVERTRYCKAEFNSEAKLKKKCEVINF